MRTVRLHRNAFINDCFCEAGATVTIADHVALAPYMSEITAPAIAAPVAPLDRPHHVIEPPDHTVRIAYHEATHEVDIDVNGVAMHVADAALKVEVD